MNQEHKLLTAVEAAAILRVAVPTLYGWAKQRRVPHVRLGDRVLFDLDEIIGAARVPAEGDGLRTSQTGQPGDAQAAKIRPGGAKCGG